METDQNKRAFLSLNSLAEACEKETVPWKREHSYAIPSITSLST